jgi:alkylation response protein AidB-like acyl-CoA dehydrogenase
MHDTEFLTALRTNAFEVLKDSCPLEQVHRHIEGDEPFEADLWRIICELGWPMLAVPEAHGGMADGMAALALLQEALGGHAAPLPFTGCCLVAAALTDWPHEDLSTALLPLLAEGQLIGAAGDFVLPATVTANRSGDVVGLAGTARVLDSAAAEWLVVPVADADTGERGIAVVSLWNLKRHRRPVADRTRDLADVDLTGVHMRPAQAVFGPEADAITAKLAQISLLLTAADSIGGATALLDTTIEYLKTRIQFGKPIGSFQAIKHRIADCKTKLEMAQGQLGAARDGSEGADGWLLAAMAKVSAAECYVAIAKEAVQMHGGIGYTWEHHAHIFLKRATLDRALFGSSANLQDGIGACLLEKTR